MTNQTYRSSRRAHWAGIPGLSGLKSFNAIRHHVVTYYALEGLRSAQTQGPAATPPEGPAAPAGEALPQGQNPHGQEGV
jgi:hypothetical protein